jgi:hypothetical protein
MLSGMPGRQKGVQGCSRNHPERWEDIFFSSGEREMVRSLITL